MSAHMRPPPIKDIDGVICGLHQIGTSANGVPKYEYRPLDRVSVLTTHRQVRFGSKPCT